MRVRVGVRVRGGGDGHGHAQRERPAAAEEDRVNDLADAEDGGEEGEVARHQQDGDAPLARLRDLGRAWLTAGLELGLGVGSC